MHVAAVKSGLAPDLKTALDNNICEHNFKVDFGRLFEFAGGKKVEVGQAVLFGSRPPPNDSLWAAAQAQGFEVVVYDRNIKGRARRSLGFESSRTFSARRTASPRRAWAWPEALGPWIRAYTPPRPRSVS